MPARRILGRRALLRFSGMAIGAMAIAPILASCSSAPAPATTAPSSSAPGAPAPTATTAAAAAAPTKAAAAKATAAPTTKPSAPAAAPAQFQESPVLADLVKQGKLPPLKERLPENPMVVDRHGKYGGNLRTATNEKVFFPWASLKYAGGIQATPLRLAPDLKGYVPNLWTGVEISSDFKTVTCHLRKGVKWSDGQPYTANDWLFWYEDVLNNKEITPAPGQWFVVGGKMMNFVKIDDYNFKFEFAGPNPSFPLVNLAHVYGFWDDNAMPAHYLKQFHIKYNEKASEQAKAAKFETWNQWFTSKQNPNENAEVPRLGAYIVDRDTPQAVYYKRNPYYWMVDADGKQLPYFDGIVMDRVDDLSVIEAKSVAGNYDFNAVGLLVKNFKTYKDAEAKGGYKVYTWKSGMGAQVLFNFNMNYKDDAWRKVFSDVRFRRAMSVAIDREEINEVLYFGLATPCQLTAHPTSRAYNKEWAQAWAQHDPNLGNKLLDEMGLKWNADKSLRLLPDNRPMQISMETNGPNPMYEMVAGYWKKLGVQLDHKPVLRSVLGPKIKANEAMMSSWGGDEVLDVLLLRRPKWFAPIFGDESSWAPLWGQWYATQHEKGEEPPAEIKQLFDWLDKYIETDDVEYAKKILASQAENLWTIGTVADAPVPLIFNKDMKNVAEEEYWVWDALNGNASYPEAWYFDR